LNVAALLWSRSERLEGLVERSGLVWPVHEGLPEIVAPEELDRLQERHRKEIRAAFVAVAPGATKQFFSWVMHIDLSSLARHITWGNFLGGVVCYSLVMGVLAWASAWAYNRLSSGPNPVAP
jgi:hypothetical protein